jgi:predicted Zn-dependent protease
MTRALIVLLLLNVGCTALQRRTAEKSVAQVLISEEQESQLGLQVHAELVKQNTRFLQNPAVTQYVEALALKLIAQTEKERALRWSWFVIDDPATVNAFATPGARVYVYSGLLLAAQNEAEVIGVLGHEMGHVVERHSARQLVAAYGMQALTRIALGDDAAALSKLAAALAGKGAQLAYSREMEREADRDGARYASGAGYDPHALATFFQKLEASAGSGLPTFLSSHPANSDRIADVNAQIAAEQLKGTELGVAGLKAAQAQLGKK